MSSKDQGQPSAAQSAPPVTGPAERCDACQGLTLGLTGEQKWCCYCGNRLTGDYVESAQSAPAGEREAFSEKMRSRGGLVDWMLGWNGERYEYQPTQDCWEYFQAGAAWQRAQSAPVVPEGELPWTGEQLARAWYLAEYGPGHDLAPGYAVAFARELAAMLAAPAQPTAQLEHKGPNWKRRSEQGWQTAAIYRAENQELKARLEAALSTQSEVRRLREALRSSRRVVESASLYAASERHKEFAGAVLVEIDAGLGLLDRLFREGYGVFQIAAIPGQEGSDV